MFPNSRVKASAVEIQGPEIAVSWQDSPVFHASASAHQPWVGLDQSSRESYPALLPTRSRSSLSVADNVWRGKSGSKR